MPIDKSNYNFYELTQHYLGRTSLLNLFSILYNSDSKQNFLNIFRNYMFNPDIGNNVLYYLTHEVDDSEFPDTISQKYYGTPFLWWVIALFNDISNPFEEYTPGTSLKILKPEYLYQLLREISMIGNQ